MMPKIRPFNFFSLQFFSALLLSIVIAAVLLWFFNHQYFVKHFLESEKHEFTNFVNNSAKFLQNDFKELSLLNQTLTNEPLVQEFFDSQDSHQASNTRAKLESFYKTLLLTKPFVMQIRVLDSASGLELVRVERKSQSSQPYSVLPEDLQDKSKRFYYQEGLALQDKEQLITDIDLNIEHGIVSNPPMYVNRFIAPIYSSNVKKGLLIINYMISPLLDQLVAEVPKNFGFALLDKNNQVIIQNKSDYEVSSLLQHLNPQYNQLSQLEWNNREHLLLLTKIETQSIDNQSFTLLGVVDSSVINPFKELTTNSLELTFSIMLPLALIFTWWLYSSYYRAQRILVSQAQTLQASEAKQKAILETALDGILTINQNGIIESLNSAVEKLFGYSKKELIGNNISMLMPEPYRSEHDNYLKNYKSSNAPKIIGVAGREAIGLKKDGSTFPLELGVSMMTIQGKKKFTGIVRDISERIKIQQDLVESKQFIDRAINASLAGVYIYNISHGRNDYINTRYTRITGYNLADINNFTADEFSQLFHPEDKALVFKHMDEIVNAADDEVIEAQYRFRSKDGKWIWCLSRDSVFERDNSGKVIRFIGTFIDITARVNAELEVKRTNDNLANIVAERTKHLQATIAELESFSYTISHDLRAPLRSLDGYSRIIEEDYGALLDEQGLEYLNRIRFNAQHMDTLINDMLGLFQISKEKINTESINISEIAHKIAENYTNTKNNNGHIRFIIKPNMQLHGDRSLTVNLLANLIDNACKYSKTRDPAIIEIGQFKKNNDIVTYVKDNGIGFDMEFSRKIFQPFQRLHRNTEYFGTGIGLASVQRIVERHGGKIWAESHPDEGATFFFILNSKIEKEKLTEDTRAAII